MAGTRPSEGRCGRGNQQSVRKGLAVLTTPTARHWHAPPTRASKVLATPRSPTARAGDWRTSSSFRGVSGGSPTGAFRGYIPGRRHLCEEQFQTFHVRRGNKKNDAPRYRPCRFGPNRKIRTDRWTQLHVDFSLRFWVGTRPLGTTTSCVGFPFPIRGGPPCRGHRARNVQRDKRCAHTGELRSY